MPTRKLMLVAAVLAVAAGALAVAVRHLVDGRGGTASDAATGTPLVVSEFELVDQNGVTVRDEDLAGRPQLVFFGFTTCPTTAMSTTETALTAHLVRPDSAPDDSLLARLRHELHERFAIQHATIQVETGEPCPQAPAQVV